ncbi:PRC-barrel domain-containing protein [Sulfitobacter sp. S223]|uniref:PRC-barrel domain-containing protein n=1 Tax=Sulfitobacter sp. S223 TaxID=2867023 RepID=UPI0021A377EB|nr:PRC-barrel domain-containing protein [Sulfitobacter sp. S223]UWR27840.1 PRC-barrel domain-containing protein [Sulfitobacter sp. S223]
MKSDVRTLAALVAAGTNNAETADQTSLAENLTSSGRIEDGSVYRLELTPDDTVWANGEGYTEIDANWNKIGEISDVLLDKNGQMIAVLVGIGGFLGVGDRDVILPLENVRFAKGDDNTYNYVTNLTKEELEKLPEVDSGIWD